MENKFDPFYHKEPTPLGASVVPLTVSGVTEINYTILFDYFLPSLSSRPVESGESSQKADHRLGLDDVDGQRDRKKKTQGVCQKIIDVLF